MLLTSKNRFRRYLAATGSIIAVSALIGCSTAEEPAPAPATEETTAEEEVDADAWLEDFEPIVIKHTDPVGQDYVYGRAYTIMQENITERTQGKVTFENYWGPSLLTLPDSLAGIRDGVADIGFVVPAYFPQELPVANWVAQMGNAVVGSIVHDVAAGGAIAFEQGLTYQPLVDELAANNLRLLNTSASPAYSLICNKAVEDLAAVEGKTSRTSGSVWTATLEDLGFTIVSVPFAESYDAFQRGVMDCMAINANQLTAGQNLIDVAPYFHPVTFAPTQSSMFVVNLDFWNSLPVELQRIIHEEATDAVYNKWQNFYELEALAGVEIASQERITLVLAEELEEKATAQRTLALSELASLAPESVTDPEGDVEAYIARFNALVDQIVDSGIPLTVRTPEGIAEAFAALSGVDVKGFHDAWKVDFLESTMP